MSMTTLSELFDHELKDIYYAEHQLVEALQTLAGESSDGEIKKAFQWHRKETQGHIKRPDQVFKSLDEKPARETCPGINGLLKEKVELAKSRRSFEPLPAAEGRSGDQDHSRTWIGLEDAPAMYRTFRDKQDACTKVVMKPGVATPHQINPPSSGQQ